MYILKKIENNIAKVTVFGEKEGYPLHKISIIETVKKELEKGNISEIHIIRGEKKKRSEDIEFELLCLDSLIRQIKEICKNEKHSKDELRNVLHNCVIRLDELKAIKGGQS